MENIHAKMHRVMSEIGTIEKDKRNDFHKYAYASEFAIKQRIQPLLITEGILLSFSVEEASTSEVTTLKGAKETLTTAKVSFRFTSVEDGSFVEGRFMGQGQDSGDKGIYKAVTGALKYMLTSNFLIPTGDDPEESPSNLSQRPLAPAVRDEPLPTPEGPDNEERRARDEDDVANHRVLPAVGAGSVLFEYEVASVAKKVSAKGTEFAVVTTTGNDELIAWSETMGRLRPGHAYLSGVKGTEYKGKASYTIEDVIREL